MALPRIDTPTFEVELPVSKQTIKFRPFLVKEQKILLMAMETNDKTSIENNIYQILENCILNKDVDINKLPMVDVEFLFLQLRARSVGEVVETKYKCENEVDGKKCNNSMETSFNILDLKVKMPEEKNDIIQLTDKVSIKMKYPNFGATKNIKKTESVTDTAFELLVECVNYIAEGDDIYYAHEVPKSEIMEFLESLSRAQFEKIENYIGNLPKLEKEIHVKCKKCGFDHNLDIEGLQSFFG
jgi:hypothetical protein